MPDKITSLQYLKQTIAALTDDPLRPWNDYPCLEWPFARMPKGYGKLSLGKKAGKTINRLVHRESFSLTHPDSDPSLHTCHYCDNPACFRPVHLFAGTQLDNLRDCKAKGRSCFGERQGRATVSDVIAEQILLCGLTGEAHYLIGARFGVKDNVVWAILNDKTYRHIRASERSAIKAACSALAVKSKQARWTPHVGLVAAIPVAASQD